MKECDPIVSLGKMLRESRAAVCLTGAGISTHSGIPDFRSAHSGMWSQANPMEVASLFGFRQNPRAFYDWVYPLARLMLDADPNAAHQVIATLEQKGYLHATITQNIDMLHQRAGSQVVYELHGHFREATCVHCFTVFPGIPLLEQFVTSHELPRCPHCRSVIKPNVILFGEQLPLQTLRSAQDAARRTDLMIVVGSSLEVAPASELPILAKRHGAKLAIINLDTTECDREADLVIHEDAVLVLPELMRYLEADA
jgi:NAD-dependent deacetylase